LQTPESRNFVFVLLFLFLHRLHPFQHIRFVPIYGHTYRETHAIKRGEWGRGHASQDFYKKDSYKKDFYKKHFYKEDLYQHIVWTSTSGLP
jgi:hypothetical protein